MAIGIIVCLTASCDGEPSSAATPPSPLLTADSDRLWILLRASRVGDGRSCDEVFLNPGDPRYQGQVQTCDIWTRHFADFLRRNGFPTIVHEHLKEPAYWEWYRNRRQQIAVCLTTIGNVSLTANSSDRATHTRRRRACDPYDDAVINQKQSLVDDLGIRYP